MRLCGVCLVALVLAAPAVPASTAQNKDVSHQDIKDAILTLVRMFRLNTDKLERHESREKHLGENLKKTLSGLEKRHRSTDMAIDAVSKAVAVLGQKLQEMEKAATQRQEQEQLQQQRMFQSLDHIQSTMQMLSAKIDKVVLSEPTERNEVDLGKKQLNLLESNLNARLDRIVLMLDPMNARNVYTTDQDTAINGRPSTLNELENILQRLETYLEAGGQQKPDSSLDWHALFLSALESHQKVLDDLKALMLKTGGGLVNLATKNDVEKLANNTNELLEDTRYELSSGSDMAVAKLESKVIELQLTLARGQEEIIKGVTETGVMVEGVYGGMTRSYDQLLKEVQGLGKVENVMLQTADDVLDIKRRIEYGVHQILLELGDLVKINSKELNNTMRNGFDSISDTILDNQNGALTNLSHKIETEISQVWRQIGIMYQQLTASAGALDRLQMQTETYVNGSLQTMDSMEGKVGQITGRMTEVDSHLNYLLGKLSLVTQEFNQIKAGLATALDNIRNSFKEVKEKIEEVGPGPNPIVDNSQTEAESPDEQQNQVSPFMHVNPQ